MKTGNRLEERIVTAKERLRRHRKVVMSLAVVVVFVTTYSLILPAITLEKTKADKMPGVNAGIKSEAVETSADEGKAKADQSNENALQKNESKETEQNEVQGGEQNSGSSDVSKDSKNGSSGNIGADAETGNVVSNDKNGKTSEKQGSKLITEKTELKYDGNKYKVTAEIGADAKLPADVQLKVKEINKDTKTEDGEKYAYDAYCDSALTAVRNKDGKDGKSQTRKVRLFDITFVSDSAGGAVEPAADVKVGIEFDKAVDYSETGKVRAVHFDDSALSEAKAAEARVDKKMNGKLKKEVLNTKLENAGGGTLKEVSFEADKFSVYGVVYTVDFHWDVDGESYKYNIAGGAAVSLRDLVKTLGIVKDDKQTVENEKKALTEDPDFFMQNIAKVEFSDKDLLVPVKVEKDITTGELTDSLGLKPQYSSELTKDQIKKINDRKFTAPDWALISLKPFSSKETLTVTMENGDSFIIKTTDAVVPSINQIDTNKGYVLYSEKNGHIYVLKTDGTTEEVVNRADLDTMDNNYKWQFTYVYTDQNGVSYYNIRPVDNRYQTLALNWPDQNLVQGGSSNVTVTPFSDGQGGYVFGGYNGVNLANDNSGRFHGAWDDDSISRMMIYEQEQLKQYEFTVTTDDYAMGYVSGKDSHGESQQGAEYTTITKTDKTNYFGITATPQSNKYLFDYWDLNGERLDYGAVIPAGNLAIPYQGSKLTAHFKRNPNWHPSEDEKEGRIIDKEGLQEWLNKLKERHIPLNDKGCTKTAELYDYENRIYRVDLTSQSNLSMFDGIIDMGFIMDVSGSMLFPSRLKEATGQNGQNLSDVDICQINQQSYGRPNWQNWGLDKNKNYYVIAERTTKATVFRINYHEDDQYWHRVDGSFYPGDGVYNATRDAKIETNTAFYSDPAGTHYQLYIDDDAPNQRLDYLQSSMNGTIGEMQTILNMLALANQSSENPGVSVAWNTFCAQVTHTQHEFKPVLTSPPQFNWDTSGGTRTDRALADALNFDWGNSNTKYAVLITDGAPQSGSGDSESQEQILANVRNYAEQLKAKGVTLITVGLSMKDVKVGSVLLYDIASKDSNGDPYFYSAQSGDELQYILYEILQKAMSEAIVEGNVTDTVNEAFYPVDKTTGKPLENGDKIDLDGNLITGTPNGPYGEIKVSNGIYTVEWKNQDFTWKGWHGTFYQKAKEDFLGGNAVRTNSGNAVIQANGYKMKADDTMIEFNQETKNKGRKELDTPRVNVNELNLTENNTEWTVYLGTEVNPREQLEELYNNILVEEVIDKGIDTNGNQLPDKAVYEGNNNHYRFDIEESMSDQRTAVANKVSFKLKEVMPLTGDQWDQIIAQSQNEDDSNKGLTIPYNAYGQDCPGNVTIKLVKNHDPAAHRTDQTGKPVETYTLTVVFSPDYDHVPVGQGGKPDLAKEYHTGAYGLGYPGHASGTDTSTNTHKINVFAKKLKLIKTDQSQNRIANSSAEFTLYRKATEAEKDDNSVTKVDLNGLSEKYVPVSTLTTQNGSVTTDALSLPENGGAYYLAETKAPPGYNKLTAPLKVTIDMTDHDTWTRIADKTISETKPSPYVLSDWLQEAKIVVSDLNGSASSYAVQDGNIDYDHNNYTTEAPVAYMIINDAGIELPSAGGPGTTWIYILGALLTIGGGMAFVVRRRLRA